MASHKSSFLLYQGSQEWQVSEPRDCFELGLTGCNFYKRTPEIEFSVPLSNGSNSCGIFWNIFLQCYNGDNVDGKPAFRVNINANTKGSTSGKHIGVKGSLTILDETNNIVVEQLKSYSYLKGSTPINGTSFYWPIQLEKIPPQCPFIKIFCTFQAYEPNDTFISTQESPTQEEPSPTQPLETAPTKAQLQYGDDLAHTLDKDRKEGISTDAILKQGQSEYRVHKCVLAVQSDFFKARFSDRWEEKDGAYTVDMNDSDLSPELLEALISGAYTGKVKCFEMALKLLPVVDKYQFKKLKMICESTISSRLTRDNVLEIYLLAKQCGAKELQKKCEVLVKI